MLVPRDSCEHVQHLILDTRDELVVTVAFRSTGT
jgi:hypothetical protein